MSTVFITENHKTKNDAIQILPITLINACVNAHIKVYYLLSVVSGKIWMLSSTGGNNYISMRLHIIAIMFWAAAIISSAAWVICCDQSKTGNSMPLRQAWLEAACEQVNVKTEHRACFWNLSYRFMWPEVGARALVKRVKHHKSSNG